MNTDHPTPDPDIRLVTVFQAADPGLVAIVKSLLESAGIDYSVRGEAYLNVMGGGHRILNSALGTAEFQVRETDADQASQVLAGLNETRTPAADSSEPDQ